jgi:signal transduction histidine kinase
VGSFLRSLNREPERRVGAGSVVFGPTQAAADGGAAKPEPPQVPELQRLLGWFIGVRWLFVGGLVLAVVLAVSVFRIELAVGETLAVAVVIASYNVLFAAYHRYQRRLTAGGGIEAGLQIGLDLVALTVLLHFMGGGTSPLVCLYLIHANVGVMLLPRRAAWVIGAGAFGLFLSLVVLEWGAVLPIDALTGVSAVAGAQTPFRAVLALSLLVTMSASMAITSTIVRGLRTRERQLEEALTSLSEKQMQLVQNEKHASMGRLVAGIAHEINNPIQFIHSNMGLLSEAFTDALPILDAEAGRRPDLRLARLDYPFFRRQVPVLLQDLSDGADRIGIIVRELRAYARQDGGRLDQDVDLAAVVRASTRLLHNRLKHYQVDQDLDPALPAVQGNGAQLQQVVVNALENAVQALPADGTGHIAVRAHPARGGKAIEFTVEDNGCGIAPEHRGRIFDPFFTTRQASGGTGLGLAIVEEIVKQHRGRIEVESGVGQGTIFRFLLPVKGGGAA